MTDRREPALKRIRSVGAASFEAAALARVDHPNLIRIHDVVPIDDGVVLVLDFAGGGSLARLLVARGRLHPGEVGGAPPPVPVPEPQILSAFAILAVIPAVRSWRRFRRAL